MESVARIEPMAELARPPGLPLPLEGILNLSGIPVPVVRLDRLFQLPAKRPGLYSMLLLPKGDSDRPVAFLVDRVDEILCVSSREVLPVRDADSLNGCVEATIRSRTQIVHVLSPSRILLERERESLASILDIERLRLLEWETPVQ